MPRGIRRRGNGDVAESDLRRIARSIAALVAVAGLLAIGIVAISIESDGRVLGQSGNSACDNPPVEPDNVRLWEHDRGVLVQWDVCPNHEYEVRWRLNSAPPTDPIDWRQPTPEQGDQSVLVNPHLSGVASAGASGEYDIRSLTNGRKYVVQLRPTYKQGNYVDRARWTDDYFAMPGRCSDLPETPVDIRVIAGDSRLKVSWNSCQGMVNHIRWREVVAGVAGRWGNHVDVGSAESYEIANLKNGSKYDVQLRSVFPNPPRVTLSGGQPYRSEWGIPSQGAPTSQCRPGEANVPTNFVVVPGDTRLYVSWRPCPGHSYQLAYRERDTSNNNWPEENDWQNVGFGTHTIKNLDNSKRYEVRVRSKSGTLTSERTGGYTASPQPAIPSNRSPRWDDVVHDITLVENQNYDEPIAVVQATDPDSGDDIHYEIVAPVPMPDIFPFAINARDGEIYLYDKLDYEKAEAYTLTVAAIDVAGAKITHDIDIEVQNAVGLPAPDLHRVCSTGNQVEVDWSHNDQIEYYELQQIKSKTANYGSWDDAITHKITGEESSTIFVVQQGDDELYWVFQVRGTDKAGEQTEWSWQQAVYAGETKNSPPEFRKDEYDFEVVEERGSGAHVGTVSANDPDPLATVRYRIVRSDPKDAPFAVNPFTGAVTTTERLDYETASEYSLFVAATDLCGVNDYTDVTVKVVDDPKIDSVPEIPNAPAIISKHNQVLVLWPTNYEDRYDLDWRRLDEDFLPRPQDTDAAMPRIIDLPDSDIRYAFRLRRVNPLGEPGDWSSETLVDPDVPAPKIEPVDVARQGQALGGIELYLSGVTLRPGQSVLLGLNMFGIDGELDNSLFDRSDTHILWRFEDGDVTDDRERVITYTAPEKEGAYTLSVVARQRVPGGTVQYGDEIAVHVLGDNRLIKPYKFDSEVPREFESDGVPYHSISYFGSTEYRPPEATKALFKLRERSLPSYEWYGVYIAPGEPASTLQSKLTDHLALGDIFTAKFVTKDGDPVLNLSFTNQAALCLPVPEEWTPQLEFIEVMRISPTEKLSLLELPVRFQPDPTYNDPALVCGHSELFDGQLFLVIGNANLPTPTPTLPPTATPQPSTATPTEVPTAIPTDTATPTPTATPAPSVETATPTSTPMPAAPTATPIMVPTATPATPTYTPTPMHTLTPEPTATFTPTPSPTTESTTVQTQAETPTVAPTSTPQPTETPTPVPTPSPTSTPESTSLPTATPEPANTATPTTVPATETPEPQGETGPTATPTIEYFGETPADHEEHDRVAGTNTQLIIAMLLFVVVGIVAVFYTVRVYRRQQRQLEREEQVEMQDDSVSNEYASNGDAGESVQNEPPDDSEKNDKGKDDLRFDV